MHCPYCWRYNIVRIDYLLYLLAAVFFLGTAVSLVLSMGQMQKSMWVVTTVVLGLASIGLGYYQRPKAKKEIVQTVQPSPQSSKLAGIVNVKTPNIAEKAQRPDEPVPTEISASIPAPNLQTAEKSIKFGSDLTLVKEIGERRAAQLKSSASTVSTN